MKLTVHLPAAQIDVTVRGMKVKEIDMLTDSQAMSSGAAMEGLLRGCLETPGIDIGDLLHCDRNAIFFGVRRATFGDVYEFRAKCPECPRSEPPGEYEIDLSTLEANPGDPAMVAQAVADPKASFAFVMPVSGDKIRWRFLRGRDAVKIIDMQKRKAKELASSSLLMKIVEVEGLRDKGIPLTRWAGDLEADDLQALNEYVDSCSPGLDNKVQLDCQNGMCGAHFETMLPMEASSFFKRSSKSKRPSSTPSIG